MRLHVIIKATCVQCSNISKDANQDYIIGNTQNFKGENGSLYMNG